MDLQAGYGTPRSYIVHVPPWEHTGTRREWKARFMPFLDKTHSSGAERTVMEFWIVRFHAKKLNDPKLGANKFWARFLSPYLS